MAVEFRAGSEQGGVLGAFCDGKQVVGTNNLTRREKTVKGDEES